MSPESLITVVSFAIAVYALLPPERSLDLKIKFAWYDRLLVLCSVVVLHYMVYLPVLRENGLALNLGPWRWGFTPELTTYSILAATALWVWFRARYGSLGRRRISAFSELATKMLHQRKNGELAELLGRHRRQLMKIYHNRYALPRLRNWLAPSRWDRFARSRKERPKLLRVMGSMIAILLPKYEGTRDRARETVRRIVLSNHFVDEVSSSYPYLGIDLLGSDLRESEGFQKKWLTGLLNDPDSVLYREIEDNQTSHGSDRHRYAFSPDNAILSYYFVDIEIAERHKLYRPIGDYLSQLLDTRFRQPEGDRFNEPLDRYPDLETWRCPAYAVIRLFDFMISEAAYQGVHWHMWLHYCSSFVDKIERNLSPGNDVNPRDEFPTPYHYLLYEIIISLCEWIAIAADLSRADRVAIDDRRVPMQSVVALSRVMNTIVLSKKLEDDFSTYMLEVVVGRADEWQEDSKMLPYYSALLNRLTRGGRDYGVPEEWPDRLLSLMCGIDHAKYHRTKEKLDALIQARYAE